MALARTAPLRREIGRAFPQRPFSVRFWDGAELASTNGDGPTFQIRSPAAIAHCLIAPGQLGLGRAYTTGAIEVDDLDAVMRLLDSWKPPTPRPRREGSARAGRARALAASRALHGRPAAELRLRGQRHSIERDREAVRHHYDVSNEFFALFLDESMTYSCGIFSRGAATLEKAQETKLELVCSKLGLKPGDRVLDVGCGWGSFAMHAAARHGAEVVGITLSEPQARLARERVCGSRPRRAGRDPRGRLPRVARRGVRLHRQHRHGRARG